MAKSRSAPTGGPARIAFLSGRSARDLPVRDHIRVGRRALGPDDPDVRVSGVRARKSDHGGGTAFVRRRVDQQRSLAAADARRLWVGDMLGARRMVLTDAAVSIDDGALVLRQRGNATFGLAVWPRLPAMPGIRAERGTVVLQRYRATVPARSLPQPELRQIRKPGNVPPPNLSGPSGTVAQPAPEAHAAAGAWRFTPGKDVLAGVDDAWLTIDYTGDVARLFEGNDMLDDTFWDGRKWNIGLKRFAARLDKPWDLTILPLRGDSPVYFDAAVRPKLAPDEQIAQLRSLRIEPEYKLVIGGDTPPAR